MPQQPDSDAPFQVLIPDHVMDQVKDLPPEVFDSLAAAIAEIRADPTSAENTRAVVPFAVDYDRLTERVYVPATRSVSYLRGAVSDISPETVAVFDQELREDIIGDSPDIKINRMRSFLLRWIEYIALTGDPDCARYLQASEDPEEFARRFHDAMERIHRQEFPDAGPDGSLAVRVFTDGKQWQAVCPVTMIRAFRPTQEEAELGLRMALLELVTGY